MLLGVTGAASEKLLLKKLLLVWLERFQKSLTFPRSCPKSHLN